MSLFEFIKNKPDQQSEPVTSPQDDQSKPAAQGRKKPRQQKTCRPEQLKFLKPCPVCHGREFTHDKNNDFLCKSCQPSIDGTQVTALGHREPKTAEGSGQFQLAFTWIMAHIKELLAAGWTRPELFRRGKSAWTASNMGVIWRSAWEKEDLNVTIGLKGEIVFTFTSGTRTTVQRCFPIGKNHE